MSQENLPMRLKNNQLAVNKRINKRRIEGLKRAGRVALSAGVAVVGLSAGAIIGGPVAVVVGSSVFVVGFTNAGLEVINKKISKDSMFVQSRTAKGEIKIYQSVKDINSFQKMKGFNASEKGAMMGLELLVSLQNIKQKYEDKGIISELSRNGESNVYPQIFNTMTHGINIKTVEALEQLGYLQIERNESKKKSNLFIEKMLFGQYKQAIKSVWSSISKDESQKHEVQMYDLAFKITDKPLDFQQIYKTYLELKETRGINPIRKPIRRLGIIMEALRNRNIDVETNQIGETIINYKAQESFASRMKREQTNSNAEYRRENYIGDMIEQGPVKISEKLKEQTERQTTPDNEIQL